MMRVAVLDACFSEAKQASRGLAATWLRAACAEGMQLVDPRSAAAILVTCVAAEQHTYVERVKKKYPQATVVVGGAASTSPAAFFAGADMVCVGDGQRFLQSLCHGGVDEAACLPNVWAPGKTSVQIDHDFPWSFPPIQAEDGAYRVWAGRGCKNKCLFCQTGWAMPYAENPSPARVAAVAKRLVSAKRRVAYLSNDLTQHSFFPQLPLAQHGSFSFRFIKKYGLPPARTVRLGVEGVSERLRSAVNKPIPSNDLAKCTSWLNANGRSVRWFLIAGLPGESASDWEELRESVQYWKRITPKGVLALSFTAWCPDPATPIATQPLEDDYWEWWESFKAWFFDGVGWSNRIKLMGPQQPKTRLKKAMASMALTEQALRRGGDWGPNDIVEYPFKIAAKKLSQKYAAAVDMHAKRAYV